MAEEQTLISRTELGQRLLTETRAKNLDDLVVNYAIEADRPGMRLALLAGGSPDARDGYRTTALMILSADGEREMVVDLLAAGADKTLTNSKGWTAGIFAQKNDEKEIVEILKHAKKPEIAVSTQDLFAVLPKFAGLQQQQKLATA